MLEQQLEVVAEKVEVEEKYNIEVLEQLEVVAEQVKEVVEGKA